MRYLGALIQAVLGAVLVLVVGGVALTMLAPAPPPVPTGWRVLRPPQEVSALAFHAGRVWAGGRDGLYAFDPGTLACDDRPDWKWPNIHALLSNEGTLWVACEGGLLALDGSLPEVRRGPAHALLRRRSGDLLVGREGGVDRFDGKTWAPLPLPEIASANVLFEDARGRLWIGCDHPTRGTLLCVDGGSVRRCDGSLPHPAVNGILEDREGTLWVATGFSTRGALARLRDGAWSRIGREDGLPGDKVRSLFLDRRGRFWVASEYDGVAVFEDSRVLDTLPVRPRVLGPADGLAGREVKAMLQTPDGALWLGTDSGLSRLPPDFTL